MNITELRQKLRYEIEHPKCKRCGKELHIPMPPEELQKQWGILRGRLLSSNMQSIMVGMNLTISTRI